MSEVAVRVHPDREELARSVAERLLVRLTEAQAERGLASIVLTGGRIAARIYQEVRDSPARGAVDWSRVDVWWGDERFLPPGDPERNETQARAALLDSLPLDPARVHPMPYATSDMPHPNRDGPHATSDGPHATSDGPYTTSDGPYATRDGPYATSDPEAGAARYADELAASARPGTARLPHFDLLLLGVGEDGHVASIFPEHPVAYETRPVAGVRGSPKPPPNRITLTLPAINTASEVWLIAAGAEKASVIGAALTGRAGPVQLPASGVQGVERTVWLLDRTAAAEVPPSLRSLR